MKYVLRHGREKRAHIQASSNPRIGAAKEEQKHAKFLHHLQVFIPTSSPSIPKHCPSPSTGGPIGWLGYALAYPKPALLYPNGFFDLDLVKFQLQFGNYIDDIRHENNAKGLTNLVRHLS